jgi:DNA-binding response OmpR family regulator
MSDPKKSGSPPSSTVHILVVDDDESIRTLITRALSTKYTVHGARDGLEAAQVLQQIPGCGLIICDVMMPRVDGVTFATRLRADPQFRNIPLVFLTAKSSPMDVVRGINTGARHYLAKPFSVKDLVDRVEKLLSTR